MSSLEHGAVWPIPHTVTGTCRTLSVPSPSWPCSLKPHETTGPGGAGAASADPTRTAATSAVPANDATMRPFVNLMARASPDATTLLRNSDGTIEYTMTLTELLPATPDPDDLFEAFTTWAQSQGFELYPAQQEALIEIVSGSNVILSTPTGSGKSMAAGGAHFTALAQQQRRFYTAPITALGP